MKARKFELFLCCLGNGITVCNKAVREHGSYKIIAHICNNGIIKLYVSEDYIPDEDIQKILRAAEQQREDFLKWWSTNTDTYKYQYLLDRLTATEFTEACKDKRPLSEIVKALEEKYLFTKEL